MTATLGLILKESLIVKSAEQTIKKVRHEHGISQKNSAIRGIMEASWIFNSKQMCLMEDMMAVFGCIFKAKRNH